MIVDLLIIAWAISAFYRGRKLGFVRQLGSAAGFFGGLLLGAWLQPHLIHLAQSADGRAVLTIVATLGMALLGLTIGEYFGVLLKRRLRPTKEVNKLDNGLGSLMSGLWVLVGAWLLAAILNGSALVPLQTSIRDSRIITYLNQTLPPAPTVIDRLSRLIDPNGFPDVFVGNEPIPRGDVPLPNLGELSGAVEASRMSVVRLKGQGCGGIVSGSGFVVDTDLIATNAHVIAGIKNPYVQDANGNHRGQVIWFDPDLDFAVLRVDDLAGEPLELAEGTAAASTAAAVLGYPGGGDFTVGPAVILRELKAVGRNIYGEGRTLRDIYEVQAEINQGNSGGPLIGQDGRVLGMVFAESTSYNGVGYALTTDRIQTELDAAIVRDRPVGTGRCTE